MNILTNKYFWLAIVAIILIIVIKQNWYRIKRLLQKSDVDFQTGESINITQERQLYIKNLALRIYDDVHSSWWKPQNYDVYAEVYKLTDNELKFLSEYYRNYITKGKWLYQEIDDVYFISGDVDVAIMARLAKIGEKA